MLKLLTVCAAGKAAGLIGRIGRLSCFPFQCGNALYFALRQEINLVAGVFGLYPFVADAVACAAQFADADGGAVDVQVLEDLSHGQGFTACEDGKDSLVLRLHGYSPSLCFMPSMWAWISLAFQRAVRPPNL